MLKRVQETYNDICASNVCRHKDVSAAALLQFQQYLNEVIPRDEHEREMRDMVRCFYHGNKRAFLSCLEKCPHVVLLTEARAIITHFDIADLVYIKWNGESYDISEFSGFSRRKQLNTRTNNLQRKYLDLQGKIQTVPVMVSVEEMEKRISKLENELRNTERNVVEVSSESQTETGSSTTSESWADQSEK